MQAEVIRRSLQEELDRVIWQRDDFEAQLNIAQVELTKEKAKEKCPVGADQGAQLAVALAERDEARRGREEARDQVAAAVTYEKAEVARQRATTADRDSAVAEKEALATELAEARQALEEEK